SASSSTPVMSAAPASSLASSGTSSSVSKTVFTAPAEGLLRVSADVLARSNKRSRLGLVVVVLALAGGGVWFYLNRSSGSTGVVIQPRRLGRVRRREPRHARGALEAARASERAPPVRVRRSDVDRDVVQGRSRPDLEPRGAQGRLGWRSGAARAQLRGRRGED